MNCNGFQLQNMFDNDWGRMTYRQITNVRSLKEHKRGERKGKIVNIVKLCGFTFLDYFKSV